MSENFNIGDIARYFNEKGEYFCKSFDQTEGDESWVFINPVRLSGYDCNVEINVTLQPDENLIIFMMPLYGDGTEGLIGEHIDTFDSALHNLNSRTKGGYFTKYTYDETYAPIFVHQLPLNRMDYKWFKGTLDYFIDIVIAFRPVLDRMIHELGLMFDTRAGVNDSGRTYLISSAEQYQQIAGW
jgi:hypothetical protein